MDSNKNGEIVSTEKMPKGKQRLNLYFSDEEWDLIVRTADLHALKPNDLLKMVVKKYAANRLVDSSMFTKELNELHAMLEKLTAASPGTKPTKVFRVGSVSGGSEPGRQEQQQGHR